MHHLLTPFFITVGQGQVALLSWLTAPVRFFCLFVWLCEWVLQHHWGGWVGESPWPWPELVLLRTHRKRLNRRRQLLTHDMKKVVMDEKYSNRRLLCNNPNFSFSFFFTAHISHDTWNNKGGLLLSQLLFLFQAVVLSMYKTKERKNRLWPQSLTSWVTKHFISVLFIPSSLILRISSCKV